MENLIVDASPEISQKDSSVHSADEFPPHPSKTEIFVRQVQDEYRRLFAERSPSPIQAESSKDFLPFAGPTLLPEPGIVLNEPKMMQPGSPISTSKMHKCPHCSFAFSRHHDLKSHLVTHSQDKPYICQTCESRFGRLHDLRRHTRLHTGERPHTCSRCGRRFARNDALARHTQSPGSCSGIRANVESLGDEQDVNDGPMGGLIYTEASQAGAKGISQQDQAPTDSLGT